MNSPGYLRAMFTVEDTGDTLARPCRLGAKMVDQAVDDEGLYRLCYIRDSRGPASLNRKAPH